jgi:hypothetical protein
MIFILLKYERNPDRESRIQLRFFFFIYFYLFLFIFIYFYLFLFIFIYFYLFLFILFYFFYFFYFFFIFFFFGCVEYQLVLLECDDLVFRFLVLPGGRTYIANHLVS